MGPLKASTQKTQLELMSAKKTQSQNNGLVFHGTQRRLFDLPSIRDHLCSRQNGSSQFEAEQIEKQEVD